MQKSKPCCIIRIIFSDGPPKQGRLKTVCSKRLLRQGQQVPSNQPHTPWRCTEKSYI